MGKPIIECGQPVDLFDDLGGADDSDSRSCEGEDRRLAGYVRAQWCRPALHEWWSLPKWDAEKR